MNVGDTRTIGGWSIHRYAGSIRIRDVRGAGKRGARCLEVAIYNLPDTYSHSGRSSTENQAIDYVIDKAIDVIVDEARRDEQTLQRVSRMEMACNNALFFLRRELDHPRIDIESFMQKGVEVPLDKIEIMTANVQLSADGVHFSFENLRDPQNRETMISRTRGEARKAYDWTVANRSRIGSMSFREIEKAIRDSKKINLHYYCAMD